MDTPSTKPHYVDNKQFGEALVAYSAQVKQASEAGLPQPIVTDYIARCFLRMAEGLSHRPNFNGYSYREEMVMDGVESCLKAVTNYDPTATTRSGVPNAFGYFTQIIFYAFLQRIGKEKKQQDAKLHLMNSIDISDLIEMGDHASTNGVERLFIDELRSRIGNVKRKDEKIKERIKEMKQLENFYDEGSEEV